MSNRLFLALDCGLAIEAVTVSLFDHLGEFCDINTFVAIHSHHNRPPSVSTSYFDTHSSHHS